MEAQSLTFEKKGRQWVSSFTSEGACVVQLDRNGGGNNFVSVSACIEGMPKVPIYVYTNPYSSGAIFELDVMKGILIEIVSGVEVLDAKILKQ